MHSKVDILINNAARTVGQRVKDIRIDTFSKTMDINFLSIVHMTKLFLSQKEEYDLHLVNINSIGGTVTSVQNADYCSSKFALRAFTDTLRQGKDCEGCSSS